MNSQYHTMSSLTSRDIKKDLLSSEEEKRLIELWQTKEDPAAIKLLIRAYYRLIIKMADKFKGYKLAKEDLISEGVLGLIKAINKFETSRELRLSTYAVWWIRASMQEYTLKSWSKVRIGTTASQKKLFFNLRRMKAEMQQNDEEFIWEDAVKVIADRLEVKEKDVISMDMRMSRSDFSLDAPISHDGETSWVNLLEDNTQGPYEKLEEKRDTVHRRSWLNKALMELNPRERRIIFARRLKETPATLDKLAITFNLSRERIRQIEKRAMEKLKQKIISISQQEQEVLA